MRVFRDIAAMPFLAVAILMLYMQKALRLVFTLMINTVYMIRGIDKQ